MRRADLLLHTKYNDPCPTVVLEAMASGLPVVYSASGGVPELVGEEAGVGIPAPFDWEHDHPPKGRARRGGARGGGAPRRARRGGPAAGGGAVRRRCVDRATPNRLRRAPPGAADGTGIRLDYIERHDPTSSRTRDPDEPKSSSAPRGVQCRAVDEVEGLEEIARRLPVGHVLFGARPGQLVHRLRASPVVESQTVEIHHRQLSAVQDGLPVLAEFLEPLTLDPCVDQRLAEPVRLGRWTVLRRAVRILLGFTLVLATSRSHSSWVANDPGRPRRRNSCRRADEQPCTPRRTSECSGWRHGYPDQP